MEDDKYYEIKEKLKPILAEFYEICLKLNMEPEEEIDQLIIEIEGN